MPVTDCSASMVCTDKPLRDLLPKLMVELIG
jgi:hypothetical protein